MKGLHNIRKSKGSTRRKKRLGRGNSSGKGNYSGKGIKGQRARAGGRSGIIPRSIKSYLLRIPKSRGFRSLEHQYEFVNLDDLQRYFNEGDHITPRLLRKKGLLAPSRRGVKVLSRGTLTKKLQVSAHRFSRSAREAIEKAGGTVEVLHADAGQKPAQKPA